MATVQCIYALHRLDLFKDSFVLSQIEFIVKEMMEISEEIFSPRVSRKRAHIVFCLQNTNNHLFSFHFFPSNCIRGDFSSLFSLRVGCDHPSPPSRQAGKIGMTEGSLGRQKTLTGLEICMYLWTQDVGYTLTAAGMHAQVEWEISTARRERCELKTHTQPVS